MGMGLGGNATTGKRQLPSWMQQMGGPMPGGPQQIQAGGGMPPGLLGGGSAQPSQGGFGAIGWASDLPRGPAPGGLQVGGGWPMGGPIGGQPIGPFGGIGGQGAGGDQNIIRVGGGGQPGAPITPPGQPPGTQGWNGPPADLSSYLANLGFSRQGSQGGIGGQGGQGMPDWMRFMRQWRR